MTYYTNEPQKIINEPIIEISTAHQVGLSENCDHRLGSEVHIAHPAQHLHVQSSRFGCFLREAAFGPNMNLFRTRIFHYSI